MWITTSEALGYDTCSQGISQFYLRTHTFNPQSEWAIPAFAFPAGTHLPTPEGWKAELARVAGYLLVVCVCVQSEQKWKQLAELATSRCEFGLAQECLHQAQDYGALTLLASAAGNTDMIERVGEGASKAGQNNVAFLSYFVLGK